MSKGSQSGSGSFNESNPCCMTTVNQPKGKIIFGNAIVDIMRHTIHVNSGDSVSDV